MSIYSSEIKDIHTIGLHIPTWAAHLLHSLTSVFVVWINSSKPWWAKHDTTLLNHQHGLFPRCHPPTKKQNISISSFQHVFHYINLYHYHPIHPLPDRDRVHVWFMFVFRIMVTLVTFEAACIQGSDTRSTTVSWSPQITTPKFAWILDDWMPPTVTKPNCLSKSLQKISVEAQSRKYYGVWVPFYMSETFADSQAPYLSQANRFISKKITIVTIFQYIYIYFCCLSSANWCHT